MIPFESKLSTHFLRPNLFIFILLEAKSLSPDVSVKNHILRFGLLMCELGLYSQSDRIK